MTDGCAEKKDRKTFAALEGLSLKVTLTPPKGFCVMVL